MTHVNGSYRLAHGPGCGCSSPLLAHAGRRLEALSRRGFLAGAGAAALGGVMPGLARATSGNASATSGGHGDLRMLSEIPRVPSQFSISEITGGAMIVDDVDILRMATSVKAELLGLSGPRTPYAGKLGVIEPGALADILVLNGNPLEDLRILENPDQSLAIIMKDGKAHKNTLVPAKT